MPIGYQNLAKSIALRSNQLGDALSAAELEAQYAASGVKANMEGVDVPYSALKQDILANEEILVSMIGKSGANDLRQDLTVDIAIESGGELPGRTVGDLLILGLVDGVYNKANNGPLQKIDKQSLMRLRTNAGDFWKLKHDYYAIDGDKIYFICSNVVPSCSCGCSTGCYCTPGSAYMRAVTWNRSKAGVNFDTNGVSNLPARCEVLWRNMVLAQLAQETYFKDTAAYYNGLAKEAAAALGLVLP